MVAGVHGVNGAHAPRPAMGDHSTDNAIATIPARRMEGNHALGHQDRPEGVTTDIALVGYRLKQTTNAYALRPLFLNCIESDKFFLRIKDSHLGYANFIFYPCVSSRWLFCTAAQSATIGKLLSERIIAQTIETALILHRLLTF